MKKQISLIHLLLFGALLGSCQSTGSGRNKELTIGDSIPAFTLTDQDGHFFNSRDYVGPSHSGDSGNHSLVIFFYPKDESMVCTKEACSFRDRYADLVKAGAVVIGINGGTVESHKKFQTNDKLPYPLLSDSGNKVLNAFGIPKQFFMTGRKTLVVNKTGKIVFTYNSSLKGSRHAEKALAYLQEHP